MTLATSDIAIKAARIWSPPLTKQTLCMAKVSSIHKAGADADTLLYLPPLKLLALLVNVTF